MVLNDISRYPTSIATLDIDNENGYRSYIKEHNTQQPQRPDRPAGQPRKDKSAMLNKTLLVRSIIAAILAAPLTALAGEAELLQRIEKLAAELEQVKAELLATKQKPDTVEKRQDALA